ncbi:MAG: hypothetical protein LBG83_05785 [Oscillospiraceae bacterium]|jgi:hypothetical protein|nr:hypothetical protein [Oscillospiraceae bacterium]
MPPDFPLPEERGGAAPQTKAPARAAACAVFFAALFAVGLLALFLPKPTFSALENRDLARMPKFSFAALFYGQYTDKMTLFYNDTFPGRERMVELVSRMKGLFGFANKDSITWDVGLEGNDPESIPETTPVTTAPPKTAEQPAQTQTTTEPPSASAPADGEVRKGVILIGDRAMGFYGFSAKANERYAKMVNRFAAKYSDQLRTGTMVVPLPAAYYLPEKYKGYSSNEPKALAFLAERYAEDIRHVELYDLLAAHKDEDIYFRTDHHWTGLGAWYAYAEYMRTLGLEAAPIDTYETYTHKNFLGSFYRMLGGSPKLKAHPDTCIVYRPKVNYTMEAYQKGDLSGKPLQGQWLAQSPEQFKGGEKYLAYAGIDYPYEVIRTENQTGRRLLVLKESFANAMLPFFTEFFDEIHVVDYRYFTGNVDRIIRENNIGEALFLNYIGAAGYGKNVTLLEKLFGFAS